MRNKLWFNQTGEYYDGIPCDDIYGGCPQDAQGNPIVDSNPPVPLGLPSPNATPDQIANDPGYLVPLADGTVVDANGNVVSTGTNAGLTMAQPTLVAGQRVSKVFSTPCPPPPAPCPASANLMMGTVTGIIQKSLPAKYEIIWDNGQSGFFLADEVTPQPMDIPEPTSPDPGTAPIEPDPQPGDADYVEPTTVENPEGDIIKGCGDDQYTIPFKIQGEEKCIDKTLALVIGALAIYYLMTKDKK